jgi:hypothetical protein
MRDTAADRGNDIAHVEAALSLWEETRDATLGYLIERAVDEARSNQFVPPRRSPPNI